MSQLKVSNQHHYNKDEKVLQALHEEYVSLGRNAHIVEPGHLVVFSLPKSWKRKKSKEKRLEVLRAARRGEDLETPERFSD